MNPTTQHISSSLASHSCAPGNSMKQMESTYSAAAKEKHIRKLLANRLKKLGSIRTKDAWEICKDHYPYGVVQFHFKCIMQQMRTEKKADFINNGLWFIHKN